MKSPKYWPEDLSGRADDRWDKDATAESAKVPSVDLNMVRDQYG